MNIGIDIREACADKCTGKGQWLRGCLTQLLQNTDHQFVLYTDRAHSFLDPWSSRDHIAVQTIPKNGLAWHIVTASIIQNAGIDRYLSPTSFIIPFLLGSQAPCVPVIHDLIAFRREPHDKKAKFIERCTLGRTLKHAHSICCVSQSTADDLQERYSFVSPEKITVVYAGSDCSPRTSDEGYILCPATLCPRKNQLRLVQAYSQLAEDLQESHPLILVGGRGWHDQEIIDLAADTPGVEWKGFQSDKEYNQLFSSAHIIAFPSLYEGFGLPVLDAIQSGIPVLTSDRGSLKEVAGDAAECIHPEDVDSIKHGLEQLLTNENHREELVQRGFQQAQKFSWEKTAHYVRNSLL